MKGESTSLVYTLAFINLYGLWWQLNDDIFGNAHLYNLYLW